MDKTLHELCKEWMLSHKYSDAQANSKAVTGAMDFVAYKFANGENWYTQFEKDRKTFAELKGYIQYFQGEKERLHGEISDLEQRRHSLVDARINEIIGYIEEFNKAIQECETPEARDRLKMLQMFVNTVEVDTKYDNTAFINGIASILSGVSASVDKLQKVTADEFAQKKAYRTIPASNLYRGEN